MTTDDTFSFVFDRRAARAVFKVGVQELVLANLAVLTPQQDWEGCLVYEGPSPMDEKDTACIGCEGPGADDVAHCLAGRFEQLGIPVPAAYEGGPEIRHRIARVRGGVWSEPDVGPG